MTAPRVRAQFAAEGLDATPRRKKPRGRQYRKLDGAQEAQLIALACSPPPGGAGPLGREVARGATGRVGGRGGDRPVHRLAGAEKNELKPWLRQQRVIPPKANAAFVANLEDVIEVYHRPPDETRPVVCVDEGGKQLIGDVRPPLPARPGLVAKEDSECQRNGVANLFLAFEPLGGRRLVEVTERRPRGVYAAAVVALVSDNRNRHCPASLYEAFEPAEARRPAARIEWHDTPKHGPWLNMAECELSVLARQGSGRRIPEQETLKREVAAWQKKRKDAAVKADWQFATANANVKLKKLYPTVQLQ
jgi:hypothetical protein